MTLTLPCLFFPLLRWIWVSRDWAEPRTRSLDPAFSRPNHNYAFAIS